MSEEIRPSLPEKHILVGPDYIPCKRSDVLELDMGDGFILYNHDSSLVHHLNPSASVIWQLIDGEATVEQLGREVAEEYRLEMSSTRDELAALISELDALGLVEDAGSSGIG